MIREFTCDLITSLQCFAFVALHLTSLKTRKTTSHK